MNIFRRDVKPNCTTPKPKVAKKMVEALSLSSKQVWNVFASLPVEHRPAYDLLSMLQALDLKYGNYADSHVKVDSYDGREEVSLSACTCLFEYDCYYGNVDYDNGRDGRTYVDTCAMPEYGELHAAMAEINAALRERKRKLEEQAHAAQLAGVEYELRSVADLTAALRLEREIIDEVTEEIFVTSAAIA